MQILPVLDLLNGVVVRGVAGQRETYRPVTSQLTSDPAAQSVARAFRDRLGSFTLYLADLDAILHGRPNLELYARLADDGHDFIVDAGIRSLEEAAAVLDSGARAVIAALETSPGPDQLAELIGEFGSSRVIFSLDLKSGELLGDRRPWQTDDPETLAARAVACGALQMIVLDLAAVGIGSGLTTLPLCRRLKGRFPQLRIITGGGVRHAADLRALSDSQVIDGLLMATALHSGAISRGDLMG